MLISSSLSGCDLQTSAHSPVSDAAPSFTLTPKPSPTFTPIPSPTFTPTPKPVFSKDDLNELDEKLSPLIGMYKIEQARSLLNQSQGSGISDVDFQARKHKIDSYESFQTNLVPYAGEIEHLFTHCLIAFPELCYSGNRMTASLDNDCITPYEFKKILQSLYDNNYILIDINLIYNVNEDKSIQLAELLLPEGKKPLIFSIDDVVYDAKKAHTGMADKLIIDNQGRIATYTRHIDGTEVISRDNEVFPILDDFVTEYPYFSFQGAKGTLALTGFQGILGYRTQRDAPAEIDRILEQAAVSEVIGALKENGWNFGSHSYGHGHFRNKMSLEYVKQDTQQWHDEVEPLIGETLIFFYPYGESVNYSDPKHSILRNAGFRLFCGVGWKSPYIEESGDSGIYQNRRNMDGYTLRNGREAFLKFYDTNEVIDPIRG